MDSVILVKVAYIFIFGSQGFIVLYIVDYKLLWWRLKLLLLLELWSLVLWNPTNVNKWHVEKLNFEIGESYKLLKIWSLNAILNPTNYKLLWRSLTIPTYTWDLEPNMKNSTYHHVNLLNGMWRNANAKLVKVASDVFKSRASPMRYKSLWWRFEYTSKYANLKFGA